MENDKGHKGTTHANDAVQDFGEGIPLVITRALRTALGYRTRDPPGYMLVFLFKGPSSVSLRDEQNGAQCTYVCRECQNLRSRDSKLPPAPFVSVASGRFITNPETSSLWEHYCKLRPAGEVFAESAINELRKTTGVDAKNAEYRDAVVKYIAAANARTDMSNTEKTEMCQKMLVSLRPKRGYLRACAALIATLTENADLDSVLSRSDEHYEAQHDNPADGTIETEQVNCKQKNGEEGNKEMPIRIGFVKQEVFDEENDNASSRSDEAQAQVMATSPTRSESTSFDASPDPSTSQRTSETSKVSTVDLAIVKIEPVDCEQMDQPNTSTILYANTMNATTSTLALPMAPLRPLKTENCEHENLISQLRTLAPPMRRSHVIMSALEGLGVSWLELITEAEAILTAMSASERARTIEQIHEVAASVADFIGSTSLAPFPRADDFGTTDLVGDYGPGVNIVCKQFRRPLIGYRTKHPPGYLVVYMRQAPSNSWLNVAASWGRLYNLDGTSQPLSRQINVNDGFVHPFQCFDCSQIYSPNWQMKKIPRVRVIRRRFVSDPEKPLKGTHVCKFRKVGEVLAEWKVRELCYALRSKDIAKDRITKELQRINKRTDLSSEEKCDMRQGILKPSFTLKPGFITRPQWEDIYREAAAELETSPSLKKLLVEGNGLRKEDSKQSTSFSFDSPTNIDHESAESEMDHSLEVCRALPVLQDIREALAFGDNSPLSETMHRSHMVVRILQKVGIDEKHLLQRINTTLYSLPASIRSQKVFEISQLMKCPDFN